MSLGDPHQSLGPAAQNPVEAYYGFPPHPSVLSHTTVASSSELVLSQMLPSPSPSCTASPSPTPALLQPPRPQYLMPDENGQPKVVECGQNLAEYLVKNPSLKRLYNNHGSIKRPACVGCNESRKKCDLERPCKRCVKLGVCCTERLPRAKKRKIEDNFPIITTPQQLLPHPQQHCLPYVQHHPEYPNAVSYGLPSPALESLNIEPMSVAHSGDESPTKASHNTTHTYSDCFYNPSADTHNLQGAPETDVSMDALDVPSPMDAPSPVDYLDSGSFTPCGAPVFGIDFILTDIVSEGLEADFSLEGGGLGVAGQKSLLLPTFGMASPLIQGMPVDMDESSGGMWSDISAMETDVLGQGLEPGNPAQTDELGEWPEFDITAEGTDALNEFLSAAGTFDWNWNIE